jgi:hypothetical protein
VKETSKLVTERITKADLILMDESLKNKKGGGSMNNTLEISQMTESQHNNTNPFNQS